MDILVPVSYIRNLVNIEFHRQFNKERSVDPVAKIAYRLLKAYNQKEKQAFNFKS